MRVGRHRIYGEIASGGTATVHLACLVGPGAFASVSALKRLHPHLAKQQAFRTMLLDEARLAARVVHPNVIRTLDVIEEGDDVVIVMEYALGLSLIQAIQHALDRNEQIPVDIAVAIVTGMLRGLHAAHQAKGVDGSCLGIVHRDVSPQNVLVGVDGIPRLIDFGIAKARSRLTTTEEGIAKGKQGYMAPEQLLGEALGREADLFAAGVVLWELLAGERLFAPHDPTNTVARRIRHDVSVRPSERRPPHGGPIPRGLEDILLRALRRAPEQRFHSALEMAAALEASSPVARPARIAEWLERVGAEDLAAYRARVAHVERLATEGDCSLSPVSVSDGRETPSSPWTVTTIVSERTLAARRWRMAAVLTAAMLGLVIVGVGNQVRRNTRHAGASSRADDRPRVEVAEAPPETTSPPASATIATTTPEAAATTSVRRPAAAPSSVAPRFRASTAKKCAPPYTFDADGHKIYKPECY